jgi:hypothetical protein
MSKLTLLFTAAAVLSACTVPSGTAATPTSVVEPAAATPLPAEPTPTAVLPAWASRVVIRSSSLSLIVEDPTAAASELEAAIDDAGGFVASASSWPSGEGQAYASLSARIPPGALPEVRRAAMALAQQIQSESTYSQDVTAEYQMLVERLELIGAAESRLLSLTPNPEDPAAFRVVLLVSELLRQEQRNVEMQLQNYQDRSTLASLDVTFSQLPPTPYLFDGGTPTPFPRQ